MDPMWTSSWARFWLPKWSWGHLETIRAAPPLQKTKMTRHIKNKKHAVADNVCTNGSAKFHCLLHKSLFSQLNFLNHCTLKWEDKNKKYHQPTNTKKKKKKNDSSKVTTQSHTNQSTQRQKQNSKRGRVDHFMESVDPNLPNLPHPKSQC